MIDKYFLLDEVLFSSDEEDDLMNYGARWFENIEKFSDQQFFETFRMTKEKFEVIITYISHEHRIDSIREKMFIFLYYISNFSTLRVCRNLMGIPKTTICLYIENMADILSC